MAEEIRINNGITNDLIDDNIYAQLPNILKNVTEPFTKRERDIVLTSTLGVLSSCLPNIYGYYDGDKVYSNLYAIIIAPAASGKGVMNKSRILIDRIHEKILNDSIINQNECREQQKAEKKNSKGNIFEECPPIQIKIMPANISTAEMYSYMGAANHGILIMESEADTLTQMLSNDWSNYSDILRKCFHHESASISRKIEKVFVDIKEPKLSLVMSGTPEQLKSLIKSKENGLYSRFIVYTFDEINSFKNVFSTNARNYNSIFEEEAIKIFKLYGTLISMENEIEFVLTNQQQNQFLEKFSSIHSTILNNHSHSFISNLNRHGLIFFRIAMVLSVLRNIDNINPQEALFCSDLDYNLAIEITQTFLKHSLVVFNSFDDSFLSENDETLLFALQETFKRCDAIELGAKHGVPKRTMDDKLRQWKKKRIILPIKQGTYKRNLNLRQRL
ncbi:DUF3987 domain-containing protein [Elizabethkingia anophelis]|uniref:DUF3987 domain-containing protein n=1 Tax=Elizabethkingia anophelis TaxID=1117645 RepID=UPI00038A1B4D|nr:DUF3987 domain-containing protein [Elizabethkingia anophelis]EQB92820.1 hypothetical protein C874_18055 [Elizabethkingia anophelis 502]